MRVERMFTGWLSAMWEDQKGYGYSIHDMDWDELQAYIAQMATALMCECAELVEEFQWKHWKDPNVDTWPVRSTKKRVADEAVDILHFLGHLLNVAGVSEDELNHSMALKRIENEKRRNSQYSY